jgi:signal transduction histidine kinase
MANGGRLSIETSNVVLDEDFVRRVGELAPGDYVSITVTDSGNGIPEPIRAKVFDPFFTTKDVGKGTGQGLTLAHATVVKKHHGRIEVSSRLGEGSTFTIVLPEQEPAVDAPAPGQGQPAQDPPAQDPPNQEAAAATVRSGGQA